MYFRTIIILISEKRYKIFFHLQFKFCSIKLDNQHFYRKRVFLHKNKMKCTGKRSFSLLYNNLK